MPLFSSSQPSLRVRVLPRFPANVVAGSGMTIDKVGNTYTFSTVGGGSDYVESTKPVGTVLISTGVATDVCAVLLTQGDWDVRAALYVSPHSGVTMFKMTAAVGAVPDAVSSSLGFINEQGLPFGGFLTGDPAFTTLPIVSRFQIPGGVPLFIFLNARVTFSGGIVDIGGFISARKMA